MPLDTHVIRVGRCLRLTRYTSPGWRMARDITASLRRLDPDDPVKYDFSLCHLGMMNACGFRPRADGRAVSAAWGAAGHARVDGGGLGDHPLDGEALAHAREAGLAHPLPQRARRSAAGRSPRPCAAWSRGGTSSPVTPSSTTSGMPPAAVATIGFGARHRVEQRRAEAFGDRAHHEQVEALDAAEDVGPEPGQQHVLFEVVVADLPLELLAQLAFAEDDEPRVGNLADDEVRGLDEMPLALVRHERGDVADDRRVRAAARTPRARSPAARRARARRRCLRAP